MNKKLIIVVTLLSIFTVNQVFAQSRIGVRAGANFSMMRSSMYYDQHYHGTHIGFHAGLTSEIPLSAKFYFKPGLLFSSKGYKDSGRTLNSYFIDIPLHFMFKFPVSSSAIFTHFGPCFSYGIAGNRITTINTTSGEPIVKDEKLSFGSEVGDHMKPFDIAFDVGVGFEVKHFQFSVQYSLGLLNLEPVEPKRYSLRMSVLSVSAAYLF